MTFPDWIFDLLKSRPGVCQIFWVRVIPGSIRMYACQILLQSDDCVEKGGCRQIGRKGGRWEGGRKGGTCPCFDISHTDTNILVACQHCCLDMTGEIFPHYNHSSHPQHYLSHSCQHLHFHHHLNVVVDCMIHKAPDGFAGLRSPDAAPRSWLEDLNKVKKGHYYKKNQSIDAEVWTWRARRLETIVFLFLALDWYSYVYTGWSISEFDGF